MEPNLIIERKSDGKHYLKRWYLIPRNRFFNIYLHKFEGSDDDRALHDHPWWSVSFNLWGKLLELYEIDRQFHGRDGVNLWCFDIYRRIWPLIPYIRKPTTTHRMILESDSAWTLFITGPRVRDWGFRVSPDRGGDKDGWMHHVEFTSFYGD